MTPQRPNSTHRSRHPVPPAVAAALGALLLCVPLAGQSQVYRWVDGAGVTHFSQIPPPAESYRQLQPPPPPAEDPRKALDKIKRINKQFQDRQQAEEQQTQAQQQQQQAQQKQAQLCRQFKRRLQALTIRPHILVKSHDGQVRRMSESRRQAQIKEAKDQIAQDCGQ